MRFCLVSTQQHWGGGESLLLAMARELSSHGHGVGWIVRESSQVEHRLLENDQTLLHRLRKRGMNWHDWSAIVRLLRRWVPDIVLLNDTHAVPIVGAACWLCPTPRPLRVAYKHTVFPLRSKLKYRLLADQLICVSHASRQILLDGGIPASRCHVIYGGCYPPTTDLSRVMNIRAELGLRTEQRMLVSVGSLLDCKGHADLVAAMPSVLKAHPQVRLVIAGEGDQRARLESQVKSLHLAEHVRLLGYRHDAEDLLAAADIVVHPSHLEGLSLVLIQAQMLEKPIVATAVGGAAEVLQADAPELCSSWIAQPQQPADLASRLDAALQAISGDRLQLNAALAITADRARQMFDVRNITQQLTEQCASWLAPPGGRS